jgi:hypothetical protein
MGEDSPYMSKPILRGVLPGVLGSFLGRKPLKAPCNIRLDQLASHPDRIVYLGKPLRSEAVLFHP